MNSTNDLKIVVTMEQDLPELRIFRLEGIIDLSNHEEVGKSVFEAHQNGMKYLLMDLSGVEMITSIALRSLQFAYRLLERESAAIVDNVKPGVPPEKIKKSSFFKLVVPHSQVRKVLHITGFDLYIDIFEIYEEALASFR